MGSINWKWLIIGIILGVFVVPFVQAKLGRSVKTVNRT